MKTTKPKKIRVGTATTSQFVPDAEATASQRVGEDGAGPATSHSAAERGAAPARRTAGASAKRQAILDAALDEFTASGFAAARMDDVAARACVAKGTIYLYFEDKEALFQELVRTSLVPVVGTMKIPEGVEVSARMLLEAFADTLVREVLQTRRADLIRLVISEGGRFPNLAEFHFHEVIQRGIAAMRGVISFGISRGEIKNQQLLEFPHLFIAPALLALIWQGRFEQFAPLDVRAMLQTHIDIILGQTRAS
jgi:AcrR family transcriptional regulator